MGKRKDEKILYKKNLFSTSKTDSSHTTTNSYTDDADIEEMTLSNHNSSKNTTTNNDFFNGDYSERSGNFLCGIVCTKSFLIIFNVFFIVS